VIPVRALKNREMESFAAKQREVAQLLDEGEIEMMEAQLQIEHYWAGALRRAVIDGDVETGSVMAGQSVGMVKARSRSRDHRRAGRRGRARWARAAKERRPAGRETARRRPDRAWPPPHPPLSAKRIFEPEVLTADDDQRSRASPFPVMAGERAALGAGQARPRWST
jgi:hypothetical protein